MILLSLSSEAGLLAPTRLHTPLFLPPSFCWFRYRFQLKYSAINPKFDSSVRDSAQYWTKFGTHSLGNTFDNCKSVSTFSRCSRDFFEARSFSPSATDLWKSVSRAVVENSVIYGPRDIRNSANIILLEGLNREENKLGSTLGAKINALLESQSTCRTRISMSLSRVCDLLLSAESEVHKLRREPPSCELQHPTSHKYFGWSKD